MSENMMAYVKLHGKIVDRALKDSLIYKHTKELSDWLDDADSMAHFRAVCKFSKYDFNKVVVTLKQNILNTVAEHEGIYDQD